MVGNGVGWIDGWCFEPLCRMEMELTLLAPLDRRDTVLELEDVVAEFVSLLLAGQREVYI